MAGSPANSQEVLPVRFLLMTTDVRNVAILGSTGSIGRSTLEVIAQSEGRLRVSGLTAHRSLSELEQQARETQPRWVVATE